MPPVTEIDVRGDPQTRLKFLRPASTNYALSGRPLLFAIPHQKSHGRLPPHIPRTPPCLLGSCRAKRVMCGLLAVSVRNTAPSAGPITLINGAFGGCIKLPIIVLDSPKPFAVGCRTEPLQGTRSFNTIATCTARSACRPQR